MSLLQLCLVVFPEDYLEEVLIPETNKGMSAPMDIQEYIQWVRCWIYMACWVGIESHRDWWSTTTPSMAKCAPFRLNRIMSLNRFDYILSAFRFTNREVPYEDGFLQMRQLEEAWNQNIAQQFLPSLINVIDESMMEWFSKWDSGFMCVVRKPHPFGNERHTICWDFTSIMWRAHIVEGKDRPTELGKKKWEDLGKTVGLILRMCEPIFSTVSVLCLTVAFVYQSVSLPCWSLASTLLRSSRSENTGPRVYWEMPLTNILLTKMLLMCICWRP